MRRLTTASLLAALCLTAPAAGATPELLSTAPACAASAFDARACFALEMPVLGWGGGIGIPAVITWASTAGDSGIAWGSTASITGVNAFITFTNLANMNLNVPAGTTFVFSSNTTTVATITNGAAYQFPASNIAGAPLGANPYFRFDGTNLVENVPTGGGPKFAVNNVAGLIQSIQSTAGWKLQSQAADGAAQIGLVLDNGTTLATAGAKLVSIQNNGTEKFAFKWDSGLTFSNTVKPAAADYGIGQDGSRSTLAINVPTGAGLDLNINGALTFAFTNTSQPVIVFGNSTTPYIQDITGSAFVYMANRSDAAGAIAHTFNNLTTLTATSKAVVDFQNNGTDEVLIRPTSGMVFLNTAAPAAADVGIGSDSATGNLVLNAPTAKTILEKINAATVGTWANTGLTIAANAGITAASGTGAFDFSGGSGIFKTSTGAVTIGTGAVSITGATTFSGAGDNIAASTKTRGTITLSSGTGTATVNTGAICVCTDTLNTNVVKCAVSSTTLTATGTASDTIAYHCLQ